MATSDGVAHLFRETWPDQLTWLTKVVEDHRNRRIAEKELCEIGQSLFPAFTRRDLRDLLPKAIKAAGSPPAWTKRGRPRLSR